MVAADSSLGLALLVGAPDDLLQHVPLLVGHLLQLVELPGQLSELSPVQGHRLRVDPAAKVRAEEGGQVGNLLYFTNPANEKTVL